jgi:sigma54-dependent transcription regulator
MPAAPITVPGLSNRFLVVRVDLFDIDLSSPINYAEIYAKVSEELKQARLPREDVELTFHLSPGTPAMAAIWILLAKTRFPRKADPNISTKRALSQSISASTWPMISCRSFSSEATSGPNAW